MPRPSLDEIFSGNTPSPRPSLDSIFGAKSVTPDFGDGQQSTPADNPANGWKGTVSRMARPVLEYGGMIGGGLVSGAAATPETLGTATIPAGIAGGALGYAGGKRTADALDTLWGIKAPETTAEALKGTASDIWTGAKMEATGQAAGLAVPAATKAIGSLIPANAAERLYGSAVKLPLSKKWTQVLPGREISDRTAAIRAGLDNNILPNEMGLSRTMQLERGARQAVTDAAKQSADNGMAADTYDLLSKGLKNAYQKAAVSSDPLAARQIVDSEALGFMNHGDTIPADKLLEIKRQVYKELGDNKFGKYTNLTGESKKGLANAAMTKLEEFNPEVRNLNKQDAAYLKLKEALERSIGRMQNKDIIGLSDEVAATAGGVIAGGPGAGAMFALKKLLGMPNIKANLAFAINKANKAETPSPSATINALTKGVLVGGQ